MIVRETMQVEGFSLEIARWPGKGTPILLLHEGLGSVALWRTFPERLAETTGRPVLAWSRQGYGQSDPLPGRRDPDYMHIEALRIPALMDRLGIERAHFLGHSDGGSISLIAAAHFPDRVASLLLEAPHVYVEQLTYDSIAQAKVTFETTDLRDKLARYHRDAEHSFLGWNNIWLDPRFRDWNIEDLLPSIVAPALLIQGEDDEYGTLDQLDRIAAVLPRTRRLVLEACGHSPHRDQPQIVLTAAGAFFEEITS